jgi:hypothetical protein
MTLARDAYPVPAYRRFAKGRIRQGDIALAEIVQLRARSGDRLGPGPETSVDVDLPYLGEFEDHELVLIGDDGVEDPRVVRAWRVPVIVLHQNCEIEYANSGDSRLEIAPIVSQARWPNGPWPLIEQNQLPGYFYLPEVAATNSGEIDLPTDWPASAVVFASGCGSSVGIIGRRRLMTLRAELLPHLQDSRTRFISVRGQATLDDLSGVVGKRIVSVAETGLTIPAPSRVIKVHFGENVDEADDDDDEGTYAYWGVRP